MNLGVCHLSAWNIMSLVFHYFWILPFCMGALITVAQTGEDKVVTWNRQNSIFGENGASLKIAAGSNLVTKCPVGLVPAEFYKIYWVPKAAFVNCFVNDDMMSELKLLVYCNNKTEEFITEISLFSGVPGSYTDFEIDKSYYIATFSEGTRNEVDNFYHGACLTHNMKLNLTVVEEEPATTQAPTNTTTKTTQTTTTSTTQTTTTVSTTSSTKTTQSSSILTSTLLTTSSSISTDIPEPTDIVITVPGGGNTGIITVGSAARTTNISWLLLVLSLCLSLLHALNSRHISGIVPR